jgi:hypothetical protein
MKKIVVIDAEKDAREVLHQEKFLQALGGRGHVQDCKTNNPDHGAS